MMGTRVFVELWSENETRGRQVIEQAMSAMQAVDWMMNPMNPQSELSRVNREAFVTPVTVPEAMYRVLERALYYSRISDGAFDISFASIGRYYDYRTRQAPDQLTLETTLDAIDFRAIILSPANRSVAFSHKELQLDLGGIAKGFAVDQAIAVLIAAGIEQAIVSAGGDSRILGDHRGRPRMIGIKHPRKKNEFAAMIPLEDTAISTSGDYERFFISNGVRFHHILDPETGRSSASVQSATVLAARAIDSDALSTTSFVLGVERGLALINKLPGVEAIIIDGEGKLHYSQGLLRRSNTTQ